MSASGGKAQLPPLPAGLARHRARLEALALPVVRLEAAPGIERPAAWYGGLPRLLPGTPWPAAADGALRFLGELDLAEVQLQAGSPAAELPARGLLALFTANDLRWDGSVPGSGWALLHVPDPARAVPLELPAPPAEPHWFPLSLILKGPPPLTGPELRLAARAAVSLPDPASLDAPSDVFASDELAWEEYCEVLLPSEKETQHQLLGHARWIQPDGRLALEPKDLGEAERRATALEWRLLWQLDSDDAAGFEDLWGDGGRLYLLIRDEDLRAARFDRCRLTYHCK